MERCTMTVREAAVYIGVHTDTIYDLVRRDQLPHIRIGRKILFSQNTIDGWIQSQESGVRPR